MNHKQRVQRTVGVPYLLEKKVLGVHWNTEEDQLVLDLKEVLEDSSLDDLRPTKRDVARITSKNYDPMGFITPVTVKMKLLCQSLC